LAFAGILCNVSTPILLQISYTINQQYITEKFCENKTKPELQCNGKCHLAKQMQKITQQESPSTQKTTNYFYTPLFVFYSLKAIKNIFIFNQVAKFKTHIAFTKQRFISIIEHPPQA